MIQCTIICRVCLFTCKRGLESSIEAVQMSPATCGVYVFNGNKRLWLEVFWSKPCADFWTGPKKSPFRTAHNGACIHLWSHLGLKCSLIYIFRCSWSASFCQPINSSRSNGCLPSQSNKNIKAWSQVLGASCFGKIDFCFILSKRYKCITTMLLPCIANTLDDFHYDDFSMYTHCASIVLDFQKINYGWLKLFIIIICTIV